MTTTTSRQPQKNKNTLNLFLNEYFQAIIVLSLILFLALAYFIFLGPRFSIAQTTIRANIDSEKTLYTNNLKKLASYKAINEIYKNIDKNDLKRFNAVLPDNYVAERLFGEIEEIVSREGGLVSDITIKIPDEAEAAAATSSPLTTDPNLGQYNLDITVSAINYSDFKGLLKKLESNLRLLDITNVSFTPSDSTAKITFTTYYYKRVQ